MSFDDGDLIELSVCRIGGCTGLCYQIVESVMSHLHLCFVETVKEKRRLAGARSLVCLV
jgi:hypothetical protein